MIRSVARRFAERFRGADRIEVLAVVAQFPLFAATIGIGLLGPAVAAWALLVFGGQAVLVLVLVAVIEGRRARRRLPVPPVVGLVPLVTRVTGATPGTEGWGVLAGRPGDRRSLVETIAGSLSVRHLTLFGLQTDSPLVYDALAFLASGGRFDASGLAALGDELAGPAGARVSTLLGRLDLDPLVSLARVMREHRHPGFDGVLAVATTRPRRTKPEALQMLAELLISAGRRDEAAGVLGEVVEQGWSRDRLLSDVINPFTGAEGTSEEAWLATVAPIYEAAGLEPIRLDGDTAATPFDRIRVDAPAGVIAEGPLVSVVMSTYRPGAETLAAARCSPRPGARSSCSSWTTPPDPTTTSCSTRWRRSTPG